MPDAKPYEAELEAKLRDEIARLQEGLEMIRRAAVDHGVNDHVGAAIAYAHVLARKEQA